MPDDASISWLWDDLHPREWSALLAQAAMPTLEQCWAYGAAIEAVSPYRARRGVASIGDEPVAMLQVFTRPVGPVTLTKSLRGPIALRALDEATMIRVLLPFVERLRIWQLRPLLWLPELPVAAADRMMRTLGKRPMIQGYATSELALTPDEAALRARLDGKWRNQLKGAEEAGLRVQPAHGGRYLDLLLQRHETFRRAKRHHGHSGREIAALVAAIQPKEDALILTALAGNEPLAGILLVVHGPSATYHVGWTSEQGRKANAHNLLLWRGMLALKARGVRFLDLGGLDDRAAGVARFKLGLGGGVTEMAAMYL
jgi:hypothetical protein